MPRAGRQRRRGDRVAQRGHTAGGEAVEREARTGGIRRRDHAATQQLVGGETSLDNLILLCTFHHLFVHEMGWRVRFVDGGKALFLRPDGTPLDAVPRPARAPDDPLGAFEAQHAALAIHEETGLTRWDGSAPDYAVCVETVCGLSEDELGMSVSEWLDASELREERGSRPA